MDLVGNYICAGREIERARSFINFHIRSSLGEKGSGEKPRRRGSYDDDFHGNAGIPAWGARLTFPIRLYFLLRTVLRGRFQIGLSREIYGKLRLSALSRR